MQLEQFNYNATEALTAATHPEKKLRVDELEKLITLENNLRNGTLKSEKRGEIRTEHNRANRSFCFEPTEKRTGVCVLERTRWFTAGEIKLFGGSQHVICNNPPEISCATLRRPDAARFHGKH